MNVWSIVMDKISAQEKEIEMCADDALVDKVNGWAADALCDGRVKGKSGWWTNEECSIEHLKECLDKAVHTGDWKLVMIYAAMLTARSEE